MLPSALGPAYDHAVSCLHAAEGVIDALAVPLQTLLLVESAQGMIESGGLAFFYEADFPNNPPYADFVAAYRRIGAEAAAECIEQTERMFPFDAPQYFEDLRQLWLERLCADPAGAFAGLSERISSDASVWLRLAEYVARNRAAFGAR